MQPYVVKQGDYLALIAYQQGFDADTVWNDPSNSDLRAQRADPNILFPGDILNVPAPPPQTGTQLEPGSTNSFTVDPPTVTITLKFVDAELASQPVTIFELPQITGLTTGADGSLTVAMPVTQQTFTVVFSGDGSTFTCNVGTTNPASTVSGIAQRLQNLGYLDPYRTYGSDDLEPIREALRAFRADQPAGSSPSPSSSPGGEGGPASQPAEPSSSPASSPAGAGGPASQSAGSSASGPPSSAASSPPSSQDLSDDGPKELGDDPPSGSIPPPPPSSAPASSPSSAQPADSSPPPSGQPPQSAPSPSGGTASPPPAASTPPPPPNGSPDSSPPSSQSATTPEDNGGLADDGTLDPAVARLLLTAHGV